MYFIKLAKDIGRSDFNQAAKVTEECMNDVWFEIDKTDSGYISWHNVKTLIARISEHTHELAEELKLLEAQRASDLADYNKRKADRAEKKRIEAERLAAEAEGEGYD